MNQIKKLILIICMFILPFIVYAEECKIENIEIIKTEIINKSDNIIQNSNPKIENNKISLDLKMNKISDYIEYKIIIKNNSNEDFLLTKKNTNSDYFSYSLELIDGTNIIKPNQEKEVLLKVIYVNDIPNNLLNNGVYLDNNIILIDNDNSLTNPKTSNISIYIILIMFLLIVIALFKTKKLDKKSLLFLAISLSLPVTVYALCKYGVVVNNKVEIIKENKCVSFNNETSWEDIISAVKSKNTDCMNVGDTKDINMKNFGVQTLRISNMSYPEECKNQGYSQTACGFVLEFKDIVTQRVMNSNSNEIKGWEYTELRNYLNSDFYNEFPDILKNNIIDTLVVSGYDSSTNKSLTSTNKLYLLTIEEMIDDFSMDRYKNIEETRVLDYYNKNDNTYMIKKYNGEDFYWWLRSKSINNSPVFIIIMPNGNAYPQIDTSTFGITPAFRIG